MSFTTGDQPKVIAHHAPITASRQPALIPPSSLPYPGTARAHKASTPSAPNGTEKFNYHISQHRPRRDVSEMSVMQLHCAFWDPDNDGIVNPWDTFIGFRALGYNLLLCVIAVVIIHSGFSYPTRLHHSYIPDPLFRVYLDGIHKAKHGSDTNTYDPEGRFRPQQFEDIFAKYANPATPTKLSIREVFSMLKGQRVVLDPFGWGAAIFEWYATIVLIARDGYIEKEDLRRIYDGTLFYTIAGQNRTQEPWKKGF
ncbi:calcium binding protein Caleosin, partial [Saitoella complicata NRRL Y-17804]